MSSINSKFSRAIRLRPKLASHIGEARHLFVSASISFGLLLVLGFAILRPIYVIPEKYHTNAATGTATQATTSLALVSSHNTAVVDVTPNNKNGTFATSSADKSAAFNVTTNNYTGYSLSITGSDNNGNLTTTPVDSSDPVRTISSISTIVSTADFSAATTASSTNYSNKWGYKPSKYVDTSTNNVINNTGENAVYLPAPTTTPTMLDKTTAANSLDNNAASANNYTLSLGIRADFNTKPGTYTNTFNLLAISNPISYTINYDKNTTDTAVSNIPARQSSSTSETTITLASTVPTRTHYSFIGWCSTTTTSSNGIDSCAGTIYNPNGNGTNLTYGIDQTTENTTTLRAMWKIDTFTQRTYIRYENADGTWGSYSLADTKVVNYGSPYSWSTAATASHQAASVSGYTVTEDHDNYVSIYRKTFTCYKQYRQQLASGSWDNYVNDTAAGTETVRYGGSCSYSKTITDYKNAENGTNNSTASTSANGITSDVTLKLDFYRNTFSLTVTAGANTSSATGGGTYRWGQTAAIGVTKATDVTCTSYAAPTWTATTGTAPAAGASSSYVMPKSSATVTATSAASNVAQTITLSKGEGVTGIIIGGANYTGNSVQLNCGTYNISGSYSTGYGFYSWGRANGVTVANTAASDTTMVVSSAGMLSLTGRFYMQYTTASVCPATPTTVYDNRDQTAYTIQKLVDGRCWLMDNLALDLTNSAVLNSLSPSNTNASDTALVSLRSGNRAAGAQYATAGLRDWTKEGFYTNSYSIPMVAAMNKDVFGKTRSDGVLMGDATAKYGVYYNYNTLILYMIGFVSCELSVLLKRFESSFSELSNYLYIITTALKSQAHENRVTQKIVFKLVVLRTYIGRSIRPVFPRNYGHNVP